MAVALAVAVLVAVVAIAVATALHMRTPKSSLPAELLARRESLRRRLEAILAAVPSSVPASPPASPPASRAQPRHWRGGPPNPPVDRQAVPAHPRAAAVEAKLLAKNPRSALAEAERAITDDPQNAFAHLLLARALVHCDELEAAAGEVVRSRELGADGAMLDYLEGRVEHLLVLRKTNATAPEVQQSPIPSLVTPFELLVLQLEKQRRVSDKAAAVWLASLGDQSLDHDEIVELVVAHFSSYFGSLEKLCAAVEAEPGFAEALYHLARLTIKVGFVELGHKLFDAIEPLMDQNPERFYFDRDLAQLRDEDEDVAWLPTVDNAGGRRIKLKVLK